VVGNTFDYKTNALPTYITQSLLTTLKIILYEFLGFLWCGGCTICNNTTRSNDNEIRIRFVLNLKI